MMSRLLLVGQTSSRQPIWKWYRARVGRELTGPLDVLLTIADTTSPAVSWGRVLRIDHTESSSHRAEHLALFPCREPRSTSLISATG